MANFANPELDNSFRRVILASNTRALPSLVFPNDLTKGMWWQLDGIHISGLGTPVNGDEAATKAYVDGVAGSGITQLTGDVTAGPGTGCQVATLANTAVTPGAYTNANITVDAKGRITLAANGAGGGGANTALSNLAAVAINTALLTIDGTLLDPAYSFTSDTTLGLRLSGGGVMDVVSGGAVVSRFAPANVSINGDLSPFVDTATNLGTQSLRWGNVVIGENGGVYFNNGADFNTSFSFNRAAGEFRFTDSTVMTARLANPTGTVATLFMLGSEGGLEVSSDDGSATLLANGAPQLIVDGEANVNNTSLQLWVGDEATMYRVSLGAADSGGTGFRMLRILNA